MYLTYSLCLEACVICGQERPTRQRRYRKQTIAKMMVLKAYFSVWLGVLSLVWMGFHASPGQCAVVPADENKDPDITDVLYLEIRQAVPLEPEAEADSYAGVESTSVGTIVIGLFGNTVPKTVKNFKELSPIYESTQTKFHRVIPGFVIQAGNFDGKGGHSIYGQRGAPAPEGFEHPELIGPNFSGLLDENFEISHNKVGRVGVANSGPNTGGSQFYICLDPQLGLDGQFVVFGQVLKGMEVAQKIANVKRDSGDKPVLDIFISKAYTSPYEYEEQLYTPDAADTDKTPQDSVTPGDSSKSENTKMLDEFSNLVDDSGREKVEIGDATQRTGADGSASQDSTAKDQTSAESTQGYTENHPNELGGPYHHYSIGLFAVFAALAGYMGFKNRRSITSMVRGPRYRRI